MSEPTEIINKVAKSGLVQLDMADFFPTQEIVEYDITQNLWQEIALKEKDFRAKLNSNCYCIQFARLIRKNIWIPELSSKAVETEQSLNLHGLK